MELDELQRALDAIPDPPPPPDVPPSSAEGSGGGDAGDASVIAPATRYRTQPGDTLESIAAAHGISPEALLAANVGTLINDNLIIGQDLTLP